MRKHFYIKEMRQRLGLEADDKKRDADIAAMTPMQRLELICGWKLGDSAWADSIIEWVKDSGFKVKS